MGSGVEGVFVGFVCKAVMQRERLRLWGFYLSVLPIFYFFVF